MNKLIYAMLLICWGLVGCENVDEGPEISAAKTPIQLITPTEEQADRAAHLPKGFAACLKPRPEMCTTQYEPVTAILADGSKKKFGNACQACAHAQVKGYKPLTNER